MDVDLLLGTEQALMLHSISINNIIPCIFDVAVASLTVLVSIGICSYVMKRKPRLHDHSKQALLWWPSPATWASGLRGNDGTENGNAEVPQTILPHFHHFCEVHSPPVTLYSAADFVNFR